MLFPNAVGDLEAQPYKYSGKEFDQMHGLSWYDFSARMYDPLLGRFNSVDPLAEYTQGINPYAYCAGNPVKYVDCQGDSLTLASPNATDTQATTDAYNTGLGGFYTISTDVNGVASMTAVAGKDPNNMTSEQKAYHDALSKVIDGNGMTTINVVNNTPVVIGDVKTKTIDIGDIKALGNGTDVNQGSALLHETWEQYEIQVKGQTEIKAHLNAAGIENLVTGSRTDPINRFLTRGQLSVPILDSLGNVVKTVVINVNSAGNVTNITR
ncbi:RHS repeat-associated core domain-containing protein [uncultured Bacteroides sp.]|uniref:RHS repeat-associated core domain-containing protein n=1 Tax=uncultured Bacteroides sp. TaxID=162156 RepID=UPI002AAA8A84|nr:RHS repeat-associated core domain-containing protein [uncultured Bacteroides sp.]